MELENYELDERIAIMHFEGRIPLLWAEFLAKITTMKKPPDYLDDRWSIICNDACFLVDKWRDKLSANGWGPKEIRHLIPMLKGRTIVSVGFADVTVEAMDGSKAKIVFRPGDLKWQEGRRSS